VAAPLAWGQSDVDLGHSSITVPSPPAEINRLDIVVPSDGILVISGSVYIENGSGTAQNYILTPYVDLAGVPEQTYPTPGSPNTFAAQFNAADTGPGAQFTLSYTVTVPIVAGAHTVVQNAGPSAGNTLFTYDKNYLTVVFYPSTHGTFDPAPADADI